MQIRKEEVAETSQKNAEIKSGFEVGTNNTELRNRRNASSQSSQSIVNDERDQSSDRTNQNRRTPTYLYGSVVLIIIIMFLFFVYYPLTPFNKDEEIDTIFEKFSSLEETSVMNKYQAVLINLGTILNSSDIISKNGEQIARELFDLSGDFRDAGREMSVLMENAGDFFDSLSTELKEIENTLKYKKDREASEIIKEKLLILKNDVPVFKDQLTRVIKTLLRIKERSIFTQGYLRTGEKEAQKVLKDHWLGNVADYEERKRAEEVMQHVKYVLELLRNMMPNLLDFESFLDIYRDRLLNVEKEIVENRAKKKPSIDTLKPLKRAVKKLLISHNNFLKKESIMGQKPKDTLYLEDELNDMNRDCTEFDIQFSKPNDVHLIKIRVWSSHLVHSLAFFYSDGSVEMFGTPGSSEPFDFEWHRGEKIERFDIGFGSVVYGFQIITTKGRNTGWFGGNQGHRFYTEMTGHSWDGLFGSFSKYICSMEVNH